MSFLGLFLPHIKMQTDPFFISAPLPNESIRPPEEVAEFRSVVFQDLLESEKAHVAELRGMLENFLEPLETCGM